MSLIGSSRNIVIRNKSGYQLLYLRQLISFSGFVILAINVTGWLEIFGYLGWLVFLFCKRKVGWSISFWRVYIINLAGLSEFLWGRWPIDKARRLCTLYPTHHMFCASWFCLAHRDRRVTIMEVSLRGLGLLDIRQFPFQCGFDFSKFSCW